MNLRPLPFGLGPPLVRAAQRLLNAAGFDIVDLRPSHPGIKDAESYRPTFSPWTTSEWMERLRGNESDLNHLTETIKFLKRRGVKVVVFGPFPVYDTEFPRLLAKAISSQESGFPGKHLGSQEQILDERMNQMAAETCHVSYVSPLKNLCSKSGCGEYAAPGAPLEFDGSHRTLQGTNLLGRAASSDFPHLFEKGEFVRPVSSIPQDSKLNEKPPRVPSR